MLAINIKITRSHVFAVRVILVAFLAIFYFFPWSAKAATYYLPDNCANFSACFQMMSGGDTLIVRDGTYLGAYMMDPPSGTAQVHTRIISEHDGGAIVDLNFSTEVPGSYDATAIVSTSYVDIEGFKFLNGQEAVGIFAGSNINVKRCAFGNSFGGTYDPVVMATGSNILIEDSWMWGQGRAMIQASGTDLTFRRIVMRNDYYPGEHESVGVLLYGARNVIVENAIALDFNPAVTTSHSRCGFRSREGYEAVNHNFYGCISLNLPDTPNGGYWGFELAVANAKNCVSWDVARQGFVQEGWSTSYSIDRCTAGNTALGYDINNMSVTNSINNPTGILNFLNPAQGASIVNRYVNGVETGELLWPWPHEDRIKADFQQSFQNIPAQYKNTARGFAASGSGLYGGPITLTSYIWEYLGSPCPQDICNGVLDINAPSSPSGLSTR